MSKEKQIEEMAKAIDESHWRIEQDFTGCHINSTEIAEALYNEGYRKQSEGEWVCEVPPELKCSICGFKIDGRYFVNKLKYCPNCGASMKGGAE